MRRTENKNAFSDGNFVNS